MMQTTHTPLRAGSRSIEAQRFDLECASSLRGDSISCRWTNLGDVFHADTGTTFREVVTLLESLGIIEGIPGKPTQFTKTSNLLDPSKMLGVGELGWHLKRLAGLGHPIESVSDLLGLNREVLRLTEHAATTAKLGSHSFSFDPRNASILLSVNGQLMHRFKASVSVFDSAVIVGDGLWESFRVHKGTILFFDEHMKRLETTARGISIKLDYSREEYKEMLVETLKANGMLEDTHIRFIITSGDKCTPLAARSVNYGSQNIVIIPEFKAHGASTPLRTVRGPEQRFSGVALDPALHLLSKGGDVQASNFARNVGADEVLMQDNAGNYVAFNSTSFFLIKGDVVCVPNDKHILRGVTRENVLRICKDLGIEVVQRDITYVDLSEATACFATGTAGGIRAVASIDVLNNFDVESPIIKRIQDGYQKLIEAEVLKEENSVHSVYGFHEHRRLRSLQESLKFHDAQIAQVADVLTNKPEQLTRTSLAAFDAGIDAIRTVVRDANHTVQRPAGIREAEIERYNGGTPELGFFPQMAFSERLALATRRNLVNVLRERELLPEIETKRIQLWSSPRNMSTAIMRAFEQRSDTRVYDEVLYASYLSAVSADVRHKHPGFEEVIGALEAQGDRVVNDFILSPHTSEVVFFKQMTHHLFGARLDRSFLAQTTNIILTRPPKDMVVSFARDIQQGQVTMNDVGYEQQSILFNELREQTGSEPIVLDSELLLANPERVLRELCNRLDLEFLPAMLEWPRGASSRDGIWGKYWYKSVTDSTQFSNYRGYDMPPSGTYLTELIERCNEHYMPLRAVALGS